VPPPGEGTESTINPRRAGIVAAWIAALVAILFGLDAAFLGEDSPEEASMRSPVSTAIAMPNVIGMSADTAESTIEGRFPRGTASTPHHAEALEYTVANRCFWTDPDGSTSSEDSWPVTSVVLVLDPSMPAGTSPTVPAEAGAMIDLDRPYFRLNTERPADVWCKLPTASGQ